MSLTKTDQSANGTASISERAKNAAVLVVPMGKRAGTTAIQGVQGAWVWASPRLQDAVYGARVWAAPRLESAADAVDVSVAPAVSSALRSTAGQVRPVEIDSGNTGIRRLLDWRLIVGVGLVAAAAGASAAAAMRRRYANATAEAKDSAESPDEGRAEDGEPASEAARAEVNGQVTAPGRLCGTGGVRGGNPPDAAPACA